MEWNTQQVKNWMLTFLFFLSLFLGIKGDKILCRGKKRNPNNSPLNQISIESKSVFISLNMVFSYQIFRANKSKYKMVIWNILNMVKVMLLWIFASLSLFHHLFFLFFFPPKLVSNKLGPPLLPHLATSSFNFEKQTSWYYLEFRMLIAHRKYTGELLKSHNLWTVIFFFLKHK